MCDFLNKVFKKILCSKINEQAENSEQIEVELSNNKEDIIIEQPMQEDDEDIFHLLVERLHKKEGYTIGKLYAEGEYVCDTLEDTDRGLNDCMTIEEILGKKIKGETAIPCGEYELALNIKSPKYSNFKKYPWAEKYDGKMPRFLNVKGYEGCLIHVGNSNKDTEGCLLVGENKSTGKVLNSTCTFMRLMDCYLLPNINKKIMIKIV